MKYFIHIPKTGGTSLRAAVFNIDRSAGWTLPIYSDAERLRALSLAPHLDHQTLFFGHFSFGIHDLFKDPLPEYVTVLREPVSRVVSLYNHHRRIENSPYHRLINSQKMSLLDFVESCVSAETNNEIIRNLTARYGRVPLLRDRIANRWWQISRGIPIRQISESWRLRNAQKNLHRYFRHVGVVEQLDATFRFIERWVNSIDRDLKVQRENEFDGIRVAPTAAERLAIENANGLDLELYWAVRCNQLGLDDTVR
jgi:hypothetical protein